MRRYFGFICLMFFSLLGMAQHDSLSLTLELVKPHYAMDGSAYFKATLINKTSDATYIVPFSADASRGMGFNQTSFLIPEVIRKDRSLHHSIKQGFFYFGYDGLQRLHLSPGESYVCCLTVNYYNGYTGMLPYGSMNQTAQVRVILQHFLALETRGEQVKVVDWTLYSNWLDLFWEDFSKIDNPEINNIPGWLGSFYQIN